MADKVISFFRGRFQDLAIAYTRSAEELIISFLQPYNIKDKSNKKD
ncbi:hypothetical protein [Enterobacter hormaechei]